MGRGIILWPWVVRAWVVAPVLAWWPGLHIRLAEWQCWDLASLAVLAVGMTQPVRRSAPVWGGVVAAFGLLTVAWIVTTQLTGLVAWLLHGPLLLTAAWLISERGEARWLTDTVGWMALLQVPLVLCQWQGVATPWPLVTIPDGVAVWHPAGSVERRGICAALLSAGIVWTPGVRAWWLSLAVGLTGSLTGVAGLAVMAWRPRRWRAVLVIAGLAALGLTWPVWWPRVADRLVVWRSLWPFLTPWGLGMALLPGGYQDLTPLGMALGWRSSLSTWVDWSLRAGWVGMGVGAVWLCWISARSRPSVVLVALWIGTCQSVESSAVLVMLTLVWWIVAMRNDHGGVPCGSDSSGCPS